MRWIILLMFPISLHAQQNGMWFFGYSNIHEIHINFYEPNFWDSLVYYKSIGDQTGVENFLAATVTVDSIVLDSVGVRFRGNASYGHPGTKKPIQLDFNEFVSGQKIDGLKKINLNNCYLDPTRLREKLFLDILNEENVPSPRCTFAKVFFNGNYIGLYTAIETINKDFLEQWYNNKNGNLYKSEPNNTLSYEGNQPSSYYDNCEFKSGDTLTAWTDLIDMIYKVSYTSVDNYEAHISQVLNLDNFIKSWAANMVFGNMDSYFYLAHNYYLYHEENSNRFEWITWDVGLSFGIYAMLLTPNSVDFKINYEPDNSRYTRPLIYFCLRNLNLRAKYFNYICHFLSNAFLPSKIYPRIDSIANVIRQSVYDEPDYNQMFTESEFENNLEYGNVNFQLIGQVPGIKDYIAKRRNNIYSQMCDLNWSCVLGTELSSNGIVNIYPNPSSLKASLQFAAIEEKTPVKVTISSMNGKIADSFTWTPVPGDYTLEYDVQKLSPGIYVVDSETGCRKEKNKMVVIR